MTKRILIIDDNPAWTQKAILQACPDYTVDAVTGYVAAVDYIREQAESGALPDVIVMDVVIPNEQTYASSIFLKELERLAAQTQEKSQGYDDHLRFRSPELILYSGYPENELFAYALDWHNTVPFRVSAYSKTDPHFIRDISGNYARDNRFLNFQTSTAALFPHIPLKEAIAAIWDDDFSYERIVRVVRPEDLLSVYDPQLKPTEAQRQTSISFDGGIGAPMVGQAALSLERVWDLKEQTPDLPVILLGEHNAQIVIEHAALLDGAANFHDEPMSHFREVARGKGLSILNTHFQRAAMQGCVLEDAALRHTNGIIREGDVVTIDPQRGLLYPGAVEFEPPVPPENLHILQDIIREQCPWAEGNLDFLPQAETAKDMAYTQGDPGISKMEHYFLQREDGLQVLNDYLFEPTEENLARVKGFLKTYIREEIVSQTKEGRLYRPTFRLFDFKPDELLLDPSREEELKALYGLDDLRGTELAKALPGFYQAQVQAILEEIPSRFDAADSEGWLHSIGINPSIVVPMVRDVQHYDMMRGLVRRAAEGTWGDDAIQVSALPMIETLNTRALLPELVKRVGQYQGTDGHFCKADNTVLIGGSDLTTDILGGICRTDEAAIQTWMAQRGTTHHPFRTIHPALEEFLRDVRDAAGPAAKIRFSGEQTQYLDALEKLEQIGIDEVTVPAEARYLEGMPLALRLREKQKTSPSTHVLFDERFKYGRKVEAMEYLRPSNHGARQIFA